MTPIGGKGNKFYFFFPIFKAVSLLISFFGGYRFFYSSYSKQEVIDLLLTPGGNNTALSICYLVGVIYTGFYGFL